MQDEISDPPLAAEPIVSDEVQRGLEKVLENSDLTVKIEAVRGNYNEHMPNPDDVSNTSDTSRDNAVEPSEEVLEEESKAESESAKDNDEDDAEEAGDDAEAHGEECGDGEEAESLQEEAEQSAAAVIKTEVCETEEASEESAECDTDNALMLPPTSVDDDDNESEKGDEQSCTNNEVGDDADQTSIDNNPVVDNDEPVDDQDAPYDKSDEQSTSYDQVDDQNASVDQKIPFEQTDDQNATSSEYFDAMNFVETNCGSDVGGEAEQSNSSQTSYMQADDDEDDVILLSDDSDDDDANAQDSNSRSYEVSAGRSRSSGVAYGQYNVRNVQQNQGGGNSYIYQEG